MAEDTTAVVGEIESFLAHLVREMAGASPAAPRRGHPTVLPALALWAGLLVCMLRGFHSQLALWRLLREKGIWDFPRIPVSDQTVYARLAQGGTGPLAALLENVTAALQARLPPALDGALAPFAPDVVALDCTTLDSVRRLLPPLRAVPAGDAQLLPGMLQAVFDVRRQLWRTVVFTPDPYQNEKRAALALAGTVPPGSLLLADLGYFSFPWFDALTDAGYFWVSRLRAKTSYQVLHTFYAQERLFDGIVWLGAHRADQAAHAVRLVRFAVGDQTYQYLTNVLAPDWLPPQTLAQLYARRWDIEMAFRLLKQHLGLHLLWSAKPVVVQQQVLAVLIIAQVLHALRLEIAARAGVDPFEVSLPLFIQYAPWYARQGQDPVQAFVERGRELRFIRPSRRVAIRAPALPPTWTPLPPDLTLHRTPRYARRRCPPQTERSTNE